MKNGSLFLLMLHIFLVYGCKEAWKAGTIGNPADLRYIEVLNAREGAGVTSAPPTVQTGGLLPGYEIVSIRKADGSALDESLLQYFSIGGSTTVNVPIRSNDSVVDEDGNLITSVKAVSKGQNGVIMVAAGHTLPVGDYYITIKVTTEAEGTVYSTVFDDAFHLQIAPLLPTMMVYAPKNQNLVYGDPDSKTVTPIVPNGNPDISFALGNHSDKLVIDRATGAISLAPAYVYSSRESLDVTVHAISNINGEVAAFEDVVRVIITDVPEEMEVETIYFFYPTLITSGAKPNGGAGYTVQKSSNNPGDSQRIWGEGINNYAKFLQVPERPVANVGQMPLQTDTYNSAGRTSPFDIWTTMDSQDLTPFQYGYKLSVVFYYQVAFFRYLQDGRTPSDLEVYISTDYTGGDIMDANGSWMNGTWTKINDDIKSQKSLGTNGTQSTGAPWGPVFDGTPYPGDQTTGGDPEGRKRPDLGDFSQKWVKCVYEIPDSYYTSTNFTLAFRIRSVNFTDPITFSLNEGRGGMYIFSDIHYKAEESN